MVPVTDSSSSCFVFLVHTAEQQSLVRLQGPQNRSSLLHPPDPAFHRLVGALAPPPFPFPGGVPGRTEPPDARPASGATPEARGVVPADGATWHCGKGLQALPHSEIPNGALQVSMGISFGMARR